MSQDTVRCGGGWQTILPKGTRLLLVILMLVTASCTGDDADPGDERLRTLREDPVLGVEPPGTDIVKTDESRGYDEEIFDFPVEGPRVGQTYRVTGDVEVVRRSFRSQIEAAGWQLGRTFKPQVLAIHTSLSRRTWVDGRPDSAFRNSATTSWF